MTMQIVFWVLWIVGLFFVLRGDYSAGQPYPWPRGVGNFLFFALLGILGWACAHLLSALP